jgi:hypothetical protein
MTETRSEVFSVSKSHTYEIDEDLPSSKRKGNEVDWLWVRVTVKTAKDIVRLNG